MPDVDPRTRLNYAPASESDPRWFRRLVLCGLVLGGLVIACVVSGYVYWGVRTGGW